MESAIEELISKEIPNASCFGNNSNCCDAGNFECNICFDLAQDPIITLCGHLFCWPCLYKWLHIHSLSQACPVCKALVQENKLVPLYGRGMNSPDLRSKTILGLEIPHRPLGQRPETAPPPPPDATAIALQSFGLAGGFGGFPQTPHPRFGNFTLSAAFGGLIPSIFNIQVSGFWNATVYRSSPPAFPMGYTNIFHGGHLHSFPHRQQQADFTIKLILLVIGVCVLLALIWS